MDWRLKGALTPIKDQGQCGSCWAAAVTMAIESYSFLATTKLQELSYQQLTDCDTQSFGCDGGYAESAFDYVIAAGGIMTEAAYPYTSGDSGKTGTCKFKKGTSPVAVKLSDYRTVPKGEANLQNALKEGPPAICLAADDFQFYTGGVMTVCKGPVNHCVQAVGFNSKGNYWIVRNQWGAAWGEKGYMYIRKGSNLCSLADDVTVPVLAK